MFSCIDPHLVVWGVDARHCGFHHDGCFGYLSIFIDIFEICSRIQSSYLEKSGLWGSCF